MPTVTIENPNLVYHEAGSELAFRHLTTVHHRRWQALTLQYPYLFYSTQSNLFPLLGHRGSEIKSIRCLSQVQVDNLPLVNKYT